MLFLFKVITVYLEIEIGFDCKNKYKYSKLANFLAKYF